VLFQVLCITNPFNVDHSILAFDEIDFDSFKIDYIQLQNDISSL